MTLDRPDISVVVPLYHSTLTLREHLSGLRSQTFRKFETILVNSSQEMHTERMVREFPLDIHFIQAENRLFPHAARNMGLRVANGEFLAFIDPDCVPGPDWLEQLWEKYKRHRTIIVGSMNHQDREKLRAGIHLCKFHPYLPGLRSGEKWIAPTSNAGYPRKIVEKLGPFDGSIFAGDAHYSWRAKEKQYTIQFEPQASVKHIHIHTWQSFLRQRFHRGAEFAGVRVSFESWKTSRILLTLILFPCLPFVVLFRAWKDCRASGRATPFWKTIHIQWAGHFFWSLGEAFCLSKTLMCRIRGRDKE